MTRLIYSLIFAFPVLFHFQIVFAEEGSDPIAASELTLDAGDKIKGHCVCCVKGQPWNCTDYGNNVSVNNCCKHQSKTIQCNDTERGGRVWGCLDKKIEAVEEGQTNF